MFPVEPVEFHLRNQTGVNVLGESVWETVDVPVDGVLVAPAAGDELDGTIRPDGVRTVFTLYLPAAFTAGLRGAGVTVRGREYRVIGDPQEWHGTGMPWNRAAKVEVVDG